VFVDESESSINDSVFLSNPDTPFNLLDVPSDRHVNAGTFSFADGHGEIHHWFDLRTVKHLIPVQGGLLNVILPGNLDVTWLQQHASEPAY